MLQCLAGVRISTAALVAFLVLIVGFKPAFAKESFLFGQGARATFAPLKLSPEESWNRDYWYGTLKSYRDQGFHLIPKTFGSDQPTELRILIKDRKFMSADSVKFVETLSKEKANLMRLYGLSNREYNRLAAMSFGILGRETHFGTNFKYYMKERAQPLIWLKKAWDEQTLTPELNSRGLTQIKKIPDRIMDFYGIKNAKQLREPDIAAVATVGFLAQSLAYTKHRANLKDLDFINDENIYDYVFYVYFGSLRQLVKPEFNAQGKQINETATPETNVYMNSVKTYLKGLVLLESDRKLVVQAE